ncbi:MAG: iron ABC transporter permease [Meiothermus sp.]|nr:iron ABC transporter permease [Meiothermus sp.]
MSGWLLALPVVVFLGLGLLYPLALIVGQGLGGAQALGNAFYWERLGWSLLYGLGSSALCIGVALALAPAFSRRFPGRELLLSLSTLPFVLPTLVVALAFLSLVGPRGVLGISLYGTVWILLWAALLYNLGLVLRPLVATLPSLGSLLEVAQLDGATVGQAYTRVALPLLLPVLLSSGSLVFLYSFSSFGVPLLLGGPGWSTLEVEIYQALAFRLDLGEASVLMLMQFAVSGLVLGLYLRLQKELAESLEAAQPQLKKHPQGARTAALVGLAFALIYSPLIALIWRSAQFPAAWASVWTAEDFTAAGLALGNTLAFAGLALLLVIPLGFCYAYTVWRGNRALDFLGLLPLIVSPVAVGLGYLLAYPSLRGSLWILLAAYALLSYPLLARAILPALQTFPKELLEDAQTLGATPWQRFWFVELPLISPAARAGLALSLAAVLGEFGATLTLQRPEWATLSIAIYERLGRPGSLPFQEATVLAVLLMLVSVVMFLLIQRRG